MTITSLQRLFMIGLMLLMSGLLQAETLKKTEVEQWLGAMPDLSKWLRKHEEKLKFNDLLAGGGDMKQVMMRGVSKLKEAGLYKSFGKEVKKANYSNVEQWASVTGDISMAYMALQLENEKVSSSQLKAQLKQLQQAKGMTKEEKAQMEGMMKSSIAILNGVDNVPPANLEVIRPYQDRIQKQLSE